MTDTELVERLWSRDESALGEVSARYGSGCLKIARNVLGNDADAEECVSDAWLRLWNAVPPERPQKLRAYLARITRNLAVKRLEAKLAQKRGGGESEQVREELQECLPGENGVEGDFDAKELEAAVNRFVHALPEREGDIFIRRVFYTERASDIAARYGVSAHTVTVTLSRTRRKLRTYLIKEGFLNE